MPAHESWGCHEFCVTFHEDGGKITFGLGEANPFEVFI